MEYRSDDGVVTRLATADDYDKVMLLSKRALSQEGFDGDYVAARFNDYVTNKRTLCFLCTKDDKAIAFMCMMVTDGDSTVYQTAARTDPDFRRAGLIRRHMAVFAAMELSENWPKVNKSRLVSVDMDLVIARQGKLFDLLHKAIYISCKVPCDLLDDDPGTSDDVIPARESDLVEILQDQKMNTKFFPKKQIFHNFNLYEASIDNLPDLLQYSQQRFVIRDSGMTSLSLGSYLFNGRSNLYEFNYYGEADFAQLKKHIKRHLHEAYLLSRKGHDGIFFTANLAVEFHEKFGENNTTREFGGIVNLRPDDIKYSVRPALQYIPSGDSALSSKL